MRILRLALMAPAIFLFATGGDGGGSDAGDKGGDTGKAGDDAGKGGITYSAEEAERIASQREERARKAALKSFFEQQGYNQEEVEKLLKEDKERRENEKTEAQREKERADKAEAEKKAAIDKANMRIAKTEFQVQAIAAGVPASRADDAAALVADKLKTLTPDDETGEFKKEVLRNIADDLVKAKPWLKDGEAPSGGIGGGANPGGTDGASQGMNALIRRMAGRK